MSQRFAVRLDRRLRGLAVHTVPTEPLPDGSGGRVEWLLDLRRAAEADDADKQARAAAFAASLQTLDRVAQEIPNQVAAKLGDIANVATELGLALAREIVGEIVERGCADTPSTVLRCLESAVPGLDVRVFLAPEDEAAVHASFAEFPELGEGFESVTFHQDASLEHGAVRIESENGNTNYDPRVAIEDVCAEVRKGIVA